MNKQQALQFIAQALEDFKRQLPPSAQGPFHQMAQQAINELEKEPAKNE